MAWILGLLVLIVINLALLYRRSTRDGLALSEYAQFLLLNPNSYTDQRQKFLDFLSKTAGQTSMQRGVSAMKAIHQMARSGHGPLTLGNVAARNAFVNGETK